MKLYEVSEPIHGDGILTPGVRIFPNESPMGLRWGSEGKIIPINKAQFRAAKALVEKGRIHNTTACLLVRADVVEVANGLRFEAEKDESDQRAFIYIQTATIAVQGPLQRGSLPEDAEPNVVTLTANEAYQVDGGTGPRDRVKRVHKPLSEAVGVRRLDASLITVDGASWNEVLLVLQPGASFRIVRGVDVADIVPEFLVTWTGHKLRTAIPARYRERQPELRA